MQTPFDKSFNDLLNAILTDYRNQVDGDGKAIDTAEGSEAFIRAACHASALWGLYRMQNYIADQIFPDSSDAANLQHHAWLHAVEPTYQETPEALLSRLIAIMRRPPAGGNRYDYVQWALSIDNVAGAWCFPLARGDGTVDVVIMANKTTTGSEIPAQGLMDQVKAYIDDVRPVGAGDDSVHIIAPTITTQAVTMTVAGEDVDLTVVTDEITTFINSLVPDQVLYRSQLLAIAVNNGAVNATISTPATDVTPTTHHMLRPGAINVTAA
jgi:uncharacterized phage protein gp47/JayE